MNQTLRHLPKARRLEALAFDEEATGQVRLHSANGPSLVIVLPWCTATRLISDGSARGLSHPDMSRPGPQLRHPDERRRRAPKPGGNDA
jgi:hypothetical protein